MNLADLQPFKWWPAAIMNWLRLPDFLFRKYRRAERANLLLQARKDRVYVSKQLRRITSGFAPKKIK